MDAKKVDISSLIATLAGLDGRGNGLNAVLQQFLEASLPPPVAQPAASTALPQYSPPAPQPAAASPKLVPEKSLQALAEEKQTKLIRDAFALANVGEHANCEVFLSAVKLRGTAPLKESEAISADGLTTILSFLYPRVSLASRRKLAVILSAAL